jgi:hypothetical protein
MSKPPPSRPPAAGVNGAELTRQIVRKIEANKDKERAKTVQFRMPPHVHRLLKRVAESYGIDASKVVYPILETVLPTLLVREHPPATSHSWGVVVQHNSPKSWLSVDRILDPDEIGTDTIEFHQQVAVYGALHSIRDGKGRMLLGIITRNFDCLIEILEASEALKPNR